LGETPLRRWEAVTEMGRSRALIRTIVTPWARRKPGCQKLHVIGFNCSLLILTAPKALAGLGQCAEGARHRSKG